MGCTRRSGNEFAVSRGSHRAGCTGVRVLSVSSGGTEPRSGRDPVTEVANGEETSDPELWLHRKEKLGVTIPLQDTVAGNSSGWCTKGRA